MAQQTIAVTGSAAARLARFFPTASPVRIPVRLTRLDAGETGGEDIVIDFGTAREVLFASSCRLEFGDRLRLRNGDGSFDVEAQVVAVQYCENQTAVAARFSRQFPNWILKS